MNDNAPLVSIGIPTFNRAHLIGRAIESALQQDYRNIEVLVSDNASTDATAAICESLAGRDERIRLMRQPRNLGPVANFNAVLGVAKGKYFMWLGDDDHIDTHYVDSAVAALERAAEIELFSGMPHYYREGVFAFAGKHICVVSAKGWQRLAQYFWQVTDNGVFYGLMRTATIRRLELPNVLGGDWLFVARVAAVGKILMSGEMTVHRELGGASNSHRVTARTLGLSNLNAVFPRVSLAWNAVRDVAAGGYPLSEHGAVNKLLAALVFCLMMLKALREKVAYLTMRGRNLLRRMTSSYRMRASSR